MENILIKMTEMFMNAREGIEGLQELADQVNSYINIILGIVAGLFGTAFVVVGAVYAIKMGFTGVPEKKKNYIAALGGLGGTLVIIIILFLCKGLITDAIVANLS